MNQDQYFTHRRLYIRLFAVHKLLSIPVSCRVLALVAGVLVLSSPVAAQRLLYHVDLTHAADHYIDVTLQPIQMRPDTMTFQMAVWAPGV